MFKRLVIYKKRLHSKLSNKRTRKKIIIRSTRETIHRCCAASGFNSFEKCFRKFVTGCGKSRRKSQMIKQQKLA